MPATGRAYFVAYQCLLPLTKAAGPLALELSQILQMGDAVLRIEERKFLTGREIIALPAVVESIFRFRSWLELFGHEQKHGADEKGLAYKIQAEPCPDAVKITMLEFDRRQYPEAPCKAGNKRQ